MPSTALAAALPDADYDLNVRDGTSPVVLRLTDSGVRLAGRRIAWTRGGQAQEASLGDIVAIRLLTEVETARGPMGRTACQIHFRYGQSVSIFGGNSRSPDAADRLARYRAFVNDLHRRLTPAERASIRFVAGFGGVRFGLLLAAAAINVLFLLLVAVAFLVGGGGKLRLGMGLVFGVVMSAGLFRLLQLNAPHVYDPADPLASATAGSVGDTLRHALLELRQGMTPARRRAAWAIGAAVVMLIVAVAESHRPVGLFEPGRAGLALETLLSETGPRPNVLVVTVTPEELKIEQRASDDSSAHIVWTASRRTLFGWTEWSHVTGPATRYDTRIGEPDEKFRLEASDVAGIDRLAKAALARAALGPGAAVTRMTLSAPIPFATAEPPRWAVEVAAPAGTAEIFAERSGVLFPPTPAPAGPPRIVISAVSGGPFGLFPARAGTWIRVINPDRSVRFDDVLKIGDSYRVPDIPGLILQTGKPDTLAVSVDGRPVQLPRAGYAGRLETVLDPQALLSGTAAGR